MCRVRGAELASRQSVQIRSGWQLIPASSRRMSDDRINSGSGKLGTLAENLGMLGDEYLRAAQVLAGSNYEPPPPPGTRIVRSFVGPSAPKRSLWLAVQVPLFFCIAQASELYLKSFFADRGTAPAQLRSAGRRPAPRLEKAWSKHLIADLLDLAVDDGLELEDEAVEVLSAVAKMNENYELRFQDTGTSLQFPPLTKCLKAAEELRTTTGLARR